MTRIIVTPVTLLSINNKQILVFIDNGSGVTIIRTIKILVLENGVKSSIGTTFSDKTSIKNL